MTLNIYFSAAAKDWEAYQPLLQNDLTAAGFDIALSNTCPAPEAVDYIVYSPDGPLEDFSPFTNARAVLNLWAGVERIVANPTLTQPLARMVDPAGLTAGMVEWVTGHVLRYHLGIDAHIVNPGHDWVHVPPPLARDRKVTVLGLGELGAACAAMLSSLGFQVTGWSRTPKDIAGVRCLSGDDGLQPALTGAEIVVLLLPKTPQTENLMNDDRLGWLAKGAALLNPGRGPLIDDDALLRALDEGRVGHATLDVFRVEPLPADHPFWHHPRVTVTPHIASSTRPETASQAVVRAITAIETGQPAPHLVDRSRGY
ncbi:2-hydroxyacid dehydrogenase [Fluviibacterium sp. S390]|uniref:2-hydroxyacid dehydrogenase n=1 Tax=Fluviibacterium sp. S390 TaxID=3415139 RepID=UPI003C7BF453